MMNRKDEMSPDVRENQGDPPKTRPDRSWQGTTNSKQSYRRQADSVKTRQRQIHKVPKFGSELIGASDLIGDDVFNQWNERLGYIKEIIVDSSTGKIEYAVLSFSDVVKVREKLFTVPWNALGMNTEYEHFVLDAVFILNAKKEDLKKAPGFEKSSWPYMTNEDWEEINSFYKTGRTDIFTQKHGYGN
ncbi:PRC-barrel domain-containing protein [Halomonas sp. PR-M31]|uniref:PRC-barrel domain-containing protein n=1 Tax=Halomonas sp. PR-M31 TaxID=1471202 RepID=UPI00069FE080|nr:PRC-barrel domain-containing protein [Halomonas sp. PR-M31]